jgi:hypothetical protein
MPSTSQIAAPACQALPRPRTPMGMLNNETGTGGSVFVSFAGHR